MLPLLRELRFRWPVFLAWTEEGRGLFLQRPLWRQHDWQYTGEEPRHVYGMLFGTKQYPYRCRTCDATSLVHSFDHLLRQKPPLLSRYIGGAMLMGTIEEPTGTLAYMGTDGKLAWADDDQWGQREQLQPD